MVIPYNSYKNYNRIGEYFLAISNKYFDQSTGLYNNANSANWSK